MTLIRTSVDLTTSLLCEESNASVLETSFLIKSVPSKSTDDKNRRHYSTEAGKTEGSVGLAPTEPIHNTNTMPTHHEIHRQV